MQQNQPTDSSESDVIQSSRRTFLGVCLAATTALIAPSLEARTGARYQPPRGRKRVPERVITLFNTHTDEKLTARYWLNGRYDRLALREISKVLRDHRLNQTYPIDPVLLDVLYKLHITAGRGRRDPFHVVSGYRSPKTNRMLMETTPGVAEHSMHTVGRAVDIRLPGYDLRNLRRAAVALKAGGVGYYPGSDFIHVDVGKVRYW